MDSQAWFEDQGSSAANRAEAENRDTWISIRASCPSIHETSLQDKWFSCFRRVSGDVHYGMDIT
jgi:hypothetical protein